MAQSSGSAVARLLMRGLHAVARSSSASSPSTYAPALLELLRSQASGSSPIPAVVRHFGSSRPAMSLAQSLKDELAYEKQQYQKPEQIAGGPPAPFKLAETSGDTLLTLTRTHKDEEINVDLHVNNQPNAPFDDADDEDETLSFVSFNVSVTKGDTSLVFECESDGTCVNIDHISCEPKEGVAQESAYTGPVFSELDEGLQKQFHSYLEERGITPELGEYLRFLIYDKEQREYIAWLQKVQAFVA